MALFTELSFSLDTPNRLIKGPRNTDELNPLILPYLSVPQLRLRFYRNYDVVDLGSTGVNILMSLSKFNDWDQVTLVNAATWVRTVSGSDTYYDGVIDLTATALVNYFKESRESYRMAAAVIYIEGPDSTEVIPFTVKIVRDPASS